MKRNYLLFSCIALLFAFNTNAQIVFKGNYAPHITFVPFGGSINNLVVDSTNKYLGSSSLRCDVPSTSYGGGAFSSDSIWSLKNYNCISFYVKGSIAANLDVTGIGNNGISAAFQCEYHTVPVTTSWTRVIIPIPAPSRDTSETGLFHWAQGSQLGAWSIWFANIQYMNLSSSIINTPVASFATETKSLVVGNTYTPDGQVCSFVVNGVTENLLPTARWFTFTSSNTAVATFSNATSSGLAKAAGTAVISGKLGTTVATGALTVNVAPLVIPTVAAPTPPYRADSNVLAIYTDSFYNDIAGTNFFPNWGQSTVVSQLPIGGKNTLEYSGLNYEGTQLASPQDVSSFGYLHFDYWTPNSTALNIFLINSAAVTGSGAVQQSYTVPGPTTGAWTSVDIPLSTFAPVNLSEVDQMMFTGNGNIFLNNIYYYKGSICCSAPTKLATSLVKGTTATAKWRPSACGLGLSYMLLYKPVGATSWDTVITKSGIAADTLAHLTKLSVSTTYQWQVATVCQASPMVLSAFTTGKNFTTTASLAPSADIAESSDQSISKLSTAVIYPNPATSSAILRIDAGSATNISITDLNGKRLWQSTNVTGTQIKLPVEGFTRGIYLVTIINDQEVKVIKLVKE